MTIEVTPAELRRLARRESGRVCQRVLMIANLLEGMEHEEAARLAGLSRLAAYEWHTRSSRTGAPAAMRVYRLAALTVGALIAARRRIGQASLSYRLRRRFVHAEHNMINCRLGGPGPLAHESTRQA
jgi:hypothetical protein